MPALSKKYKINYKRRYTITKNKKQGGYKSIKVYHNRAKSPTRKRKYYMGGDIEAPAINNIFPSGQSYQPNTNCLEKECDKKDDAGEKTTTCLNTRIVMNLFRQNLDTSELATMDRIDYNFTAEERNHVKDLTEKYITNYVDSLFSRSIFSKNNVDLTPENTQKLKDLLEVIKPEYVVYLTQNSNLSDDIKQTIRDTTQEELNVVADNDVIDNALAATSAPATAPATAPVNIPADNTNANSTSDAPATMPVDDAAANANAPADNTNASNTDVVDAAAEAEAQTQQAAEAQAERLRLEAEAETQRQKAEAEAQKAAKKEEKAKYYAAKKEEMDQRFAQRRADSAAKKIEIDKQNADKKAERAAAEVKRKEDLAEKKAARAAAALIKEENIAAAANEKKKQRDSAKTSKNKPKSKNGGGTRKKH